MGKYPLSEEEFKTFYSRVPRITAEVIIRGEKGVVLALRRHKTWNNMWHIPGGTVYNGELMQDAVYRVAQDEVGVSVLIKELIGFIHYPSEIVQRGFGWSIGLAILCETADELPQFNEEQEELRYFNVLPENLVVEQRGVLQAVLDGVSWNSFSQVTKG